MLFASQNLTAGELNAIVKKLGGEKAAKRLLQGKIHVVGPVEEWRTVNLGTGLKTLEEFRGALVNSGVQIIHDDETGFFNIPEAQFFKVSETPRQVKLARVTARELGFKGDGAPVLDVIKRAKNLSLALCDWEMVLQLRLQWLDQKQYSGVEVFVEPPTKTDRTFDDFGLTNHNYSTSDCRLTIGGQCSKKWEMGHQSLDEEMVFLILE